MQNGDPVQPKYEATYYTIPRDEWIYNVAPFRAGKILSCRFQPLYDENIQTQVTTKISGHREKRVIEVSYREIETVNGEVTRPDIGFDHLKNQLPTSVDVNINYGDKSAHRKVPVQIDRTKLSQEAYFDYNYQPKVPAGCEITNDETGGIGTLGTPAYDHDVGGYIWLTAGHLGDINDQVNQPDSDLVGKIEKKKQDGNFDAAEIWESLQDQDDSNQEYQIAGNSGGDDYDHQIWGTVGWDKIVDNVDTSYELSVQGRTTGRNSGEIVCATTETCESNAQYRSIIVEVDTMSGDSGGPYFEVRNSDEAYIAGSHAFGGIDNDGDGAGEGEGTYIGEIENEFNLTV